MFPVITIFTAALDGISSTSSGTLDHSMPLCVPTFYSPNVDHTRLYNLRSRLIGIALAFVAYGLIYIFASISSNFFPFPSVQEKVLWNLFFVTLYLCIALIAALPIALFESIGGHGFTRRSNRRFWDVFAQVMMVASITIYLLAKIAFLILAFIELRGLSPTKLVGIKWTSFIPHIS